jgi:hypothetical protein
MNEGQASPYPPAPAPVPARTRTRTRQPSASAHASARTRPHPRPYPRPNRLAPTPTRARPPPARPPAPGRQQRPPTHPRPPSPTRPRPWQLQRPRPPAHSPAPALAKKQPPATAPACASPCPPAPTVQEPSVTSGPGATHSRLGSAATSSCPAVSESESVQLGRRRSNLAESSDPPTEARPAAGRGPLVPAQADRASEPSIGGQGRDRITGLLVCPANL